MCERSVSLYFQVAPTLYVMVVLPFSQLSIATVASLSCWVSACEHETRDFLAHVCVGECDRHKGEKKERYLFAGFLSNIISIFQ